ncbi:MAG: formylglycine-generating enzyme family protein, partial [Muribaculaceae bacterium]|nr:formylglycine-generating enzyme family protein [Muribaculaceae bacterium]
TIKNVYLSTIKPIFFCGSLLFVFSCQKDTIDISDPTQALNSISTKWGSTTTEIRKHMNGYTPIKEEDQIMIFQGKNGDNYISYKFIDNKLSGSLLMIKNLDNNTVFDNYLKSYQYVGNINKDMIYQSQGKNTLAITKTDNDGLEYSSIGFTPLVSDEYEKAEPYGVATEDEIKILPTEVTLYGNLSGVDKETEVGFMLSLVPDIEESKCRIATGKSAGGKFEITLHGIAGQETYYYKAYTLIDGKYFYGEVKSFETDPLMYTVNGKEFHVIKVEGGPYGTFSVLQTEISAKDEVTFGGKDLGIILDNDRVDGNISLYESKKFIGNLLKMTGLAWRYPTSEEWEFMASGGIFSNDFTYSGSNNIEDVAWYKDDCSGPKGPGLKLANELGLFDMSGNYAELTNDQQIKNIEAEIFLLSDDYKYDGTQAYGGYWNSSASQCKVNSHEATKFLEKALIDGKKYAFRLIFPHNVKAYNE